MTTFVTATFKTRNAAQSYLNDIEALGVTSDQISTVTTDETRGNSFNIDESSKAPEGAATGASLGGLVGVVLGALATAGTLVIPGLNIVVGGALVGALAGLGTGAMAGGLLGGLVGAGIPEHEATIYENEIKNGAVLIAVAAKDSDQAEQLRDLLKRNDAYNIAA